ncbi:3-hydroxyisobutyryl-coenzyme A hydrolase, putative [Plasmodium vinckei vinckei]|uniref:3-hydroxyisobutyryl-CoA hydrolase n=1 Tax=Plasmodium vinckei vinckei TaxID=54757 RepID=A0A449C0X4_PLAVN|nr:3-hydroxyisobutyryl-coenzyme A hydrolase, putative [Plasmodium vinckei vinckei]VEV59321.1 3-hydroxyisobutyryl-coenzyme A hydrolase, putative [Plasmodium vinckei vinckei]
MLNQRKCFHLSILKLKNISHIKKLKWNEINSSDKNYLFTCTNFEKKKPHVKNLVTYENKNAKSFYKYSNNSNLHTNTQKVENNNKNVLSKKMENTNENINLNKRYISDEPNKDDNFRNAEKEKNNELDRYNMENMNDGIKSKNGNCDDIIDLTLSDVWSKKTLIVEYKNNIFEIILNRKEKLNAINKDMINGLLNMVKSLSNDDRCNLIVIRSINQNCFCSGSDVKDIVQNKEQGINHLKQLYKYINFISKINKNVLCIWNGYAMGGGLGISMYTKYRIINTKVIFAMPENKIGFFPDVGSCYFLKKHFPRNIALHIGLTSLRLNEIDLINFKVCTNYIENIDSFLNELYNIKKEVPNKFNEELIKILNKYPPKVNINAKPVLTEELISNIDKYYTSANTLEELINNLKNDEDNNNFCKQLLSDINANCYFSCQLWFSYFIYNYDKSMEEVLDNDFKMTQYFLYHTNTFEKGVTEVLIKKNKNFQWSKDHENNPVQLEETIEDILMNKNLLSIKDEFI